MKYIKTYNMFLNESRVSVDANGSQIDCYATDWEAGNLAYMSIVNRSAEGWVLHKIGIFHGLSKDEMIKYNNEIQALMLESAIKRDDYKYFICKNETEKQMFDTLRWKEMANQEITGAIIKPDVKLHVDEFKNIVETHFPFVYFTNTSGSEVNIDPFSGRE